jgi:uncharacterized membrane-anchored protein
MHKQIVIPSRAVPTSFTGNHRSAHPSPTQQTMNKLPQITFAFWVMKICATTLGETAGDHMSHTMQIGYLWSSVILFTVFGLLLFFQLRARSYTPFLYWGVILATSTAGTTMSDFMDRSLELGYAKGSLILVSILAVIFGIWWKLEKSLSVVNIRTIRAEILYWVAILFSNTLGTALGDYLADDSGLGFMGGALLIGGALAVVTALAFFTKLSKVLLFWIAFVLTRPFGATFGDVLTKEHEQGGLALGTAASSMVLGAILLTVIMITMRKSNKDASIA